MPAMRVEYPELSSPDPLADSLMDEYASQPSPRRSSIPNTIRGGQRARKNSDIAISSSGVIVDQTTSPWRIKVTVQAEHEGDLETGAGRGKTITRTMKVPLRDPGSPSKSPKKMSRTANAQNNDGAPISPRKTRSRRKSVTDLDAVVLGDDAEEDEWTGRRRSPRKRNQNNTENSKKPNTTTQRSISDSFAIREDGRDSDLGDGTPQPPRDDITPEMREVDLNKIALRARPRSDKQAARTEQESGRDTRNVSMNSAMSYPTPSPTASEFGHSDDHQQPISNENDVGLDTVMESEGFTMIDLDSLPSVKHMRNTPEYPTIAEETEDSTNFEQTEQKHHSKVSAPSISLSTLPEEDSTDLSHELQSSPPNLATGTKKKPYSIGHLQLPSSTNVYRHRHVTPMPQTSPSLPSPPRAPASVTKERSPANSDKVVKAAIVLQDTVTPEHSLLSDPGQRDDLGDRRDDALFGGFSSSTRRELRAELRFGEELSKKQFPEEDQLQNTKAAKTSRIVPALERPQVWRGETTVQHTPPVALATKARSLQDPQSMQSKSSSEISRNAPAVDGTETTWEARARKEREQVIEQANAVDSEDLLVIDSDSEVEESNEDQNDVDETMGDIWLAEARNNSSSPREILQNNELANEKPKRRLIPSPWKRGEQIDAKDVSQIAGEDSFTGMFSRHHIETRTGGFGAAIIANPQKVLQEGLEFDRRRSGEFADGGKISRQPRRLSPRRDENKENNHSYNDELDQDRNSLEWRNASDVIEEETSILEAAHKLSDDRQVDGVMGATTHLYETNLEGLSEQDLSSSPHIQLSKEQQVAVAEHDSTYSSLSEESTDETYRQRTSLSPSKERPNTPRSALKGGRASFGAALTFMDDNQEANDRKVVWAKRMSCMNEEWEESSRSIRSTQESFEDDTPTPLTIEKPLSQIREQRQHENSFMVDPQPPRQEQSNKGWFSWFKQSNYAESAEDEVHQPAEYAKPKSDKIAGLDGSIDEFIKDDHNLEHDDPSYAPTSRHTSVEVKPVKTRAHTILPAPTEKSTSPTTHNRTSQPKTSSQPSTKLPSYLKPPSYPSDPHRDPSLPLAISGAFTNPHFRTLHIIYKKFLSPRFHGPAYPEEIRPELLSLVEEGWTLAVDESETMDETFEFKVGIPEAMTLERFMREVEHGYSDNGVEMEAWGWKCEELAEWLGRIAVGEVIRKEEKEARKILSGKKIERC